MQEQEAVEALKAEGFEDVYVWEDKPNYEYPEHTHEKLTAHLILKGELILNDRGGHKSLKAGDRFDIPAGTTHTARTGPEGARYVIGEK